MRNIPHRIFITCLNLLFPPLAVGLLDGFSTDCLTNSCLFLCGVIPSHIHGFYIGCVYFARKRRVRKGRYPGGAKAGIFTDRVLNGGASDREVERLFVKQMGEKGDGKGGKRQRSRDERGSPRPRSRDGRESPRIGYTGSVDGYGGTPSRVGSRRCEVGGSGRAPVQRSSWR